MVSKELATQILNRAYNDACNMINPVCDHQELIDFVIDNNHLTYKYVLFNALLAKATDQSVNPLCLQKKSTLPGAYDARTLCHEVIVPFEKMTLNKVLGGSNEPFLNKPARFTELNKNNAVRRGNDKHILDMLCDKLPEIITSDDAYHCLVYLLKKLIIHSNEINNLMSYTIPNSVNSPINLINYIFNALGESFEGETLTLMIAGVYHLAYKNVPNAIVDVHPVNQSGKSSKEISDLDIYVDKRLVVSNELKDKVFSEIDIRHAADKVMQAGGNNMLFIIGPHGTNNEKISPTLIEEYASQNFTLHIVSYADFFRLSISTLLVIDCDEFLKYILNVAHETKFKEETIVYLLNLAHSYFKLQ